MPVYGETKSAQGPNIYTKLLNTEANLLVLPSRNEQFADWGGFGHG